MKIVNMAQMLHFAIEAILDFNSQGSKCMFSSKEGTGQNLNSGSTPKKPEISINGGMSSSVIDQDLTIVGNAYSKGEIHVRGDFNGDIQCTTLQVGENAEVSGNLYAKEIIVSGVVNGNVTGSRVTLKGTSTINGDVFHDELAIEQGAVFAGTSFQNTAKPKAPETPKAPIGFHKPASNGAAVAQPAVASPSK